MSPGRLDDERIDGERFAVEPLTPTLVQAVTRLIAALRAAAGPRQVEIAPTIAIGGWLLRPDVLVRACDDSALLVAEARRDSTDRYALGLKRLAYAAAGIPSYWFLDPRPGRLRVFRLEGRNYGWPGESLGAGDIATAGTLAVPVATLLAPASPGPGRP